MVNVIDYLGSQWVNAVDNLRAKATEFTGLYNQLLRLEYVANESPDLLPKYDALLNRGRQLRTTIQRVTNAIDEAYRFVRDTFGIGNIGNLGVIPFIPIAVIISVLSALGIWITDAYSTIALLNERKVLRAQGVTPENITALQTGAKKWYNFEYSNILLPVVGIAGAALLFALLSRKK